MPKVPKQYKCGHPFRPDKFPHDLLHADPDIAFTEKMPCVCPECHKKKCMEESRKYYTELQRVLGEYSKMLDKIEEDRDLVHPATMILDLHRWHCRRREAKEEYKKLFEEIWTKYHKRWWTHFVPWEYWVH